MTKRTDVIKAIQKAVIAAVAVSSKANLPIKALGITFEIPEDGKYLDLIDVANDRGNDYWGNERVFQGSFRAILHWPINSTGVYEPSDYIDELVAMFPKEKLFMSGGLTVKIYDHPSNSGMIPNGSELIFPLVLPYRCFAT